MALADPADDAIPVVRIGLADAAPARALAAMLQGYGIALVQLPPGSVIPGSYWGAPEAGLIGDVLYVRQDTPLHSALHEACHHICMDNDRRTRLDTDAGGDTLEECAVCYLSIVLAGKFSGFGRDAMLADMDAWGYSFRLGSARAWFERDADDAQQWLSERGLLPR